MGFKSFEQHAVDKLRELGEATKTEWAKALGYKTASAFHWTYQKIDKQGLIRKNKRGNKTFCSLIEKEQEKEENIKKCM